MKGVTGTEWEFEDTLKSHRERNQPDILLYRKQAGHRQPQRRDGGL
jgi:hypothetical protein